MPIINITHKDISFQPYPHGVSDQMLEASLFQSLQTEFPSEDIFSKNQIQPFKEGRASRINLMRHNPLFKEFMEKSSIWSAFYNQINSREFVEEIIDLFESQILEVGGTVQPTDWTFTNHEPRGPESLLERGVHKIGLATFLDGIKAAVSLKALCVSFDIAWARDGYSTEVHTDNRNKLAAFLIYFNETDGTGGEFLVHKLKDGLTVPSDPRYPTDEEVEVVQTLSPKPNRGAIFLNCNRAYHGVNPLRGCTTARKFLYVSIGSKYSRPIWRPT